MGKLKLIGLIIFTMVWTTGCWDKVEIEKRAFVTIIGIDKFHQKEGEESGGENRYTITYAYPNTGMIAGKGEGEIRFTITATGENIYSIRYGLGTRTGKNLYLAHIKAILIGEGLAKDEVLMRETLDIIERSPEIGRKIHFMITPGDTKDVVNVGPKDQPILGLFIRDLMDQNSRSARIADADIGYILRSLHESKTAIVPRIVSSKDGVKIAGAAILKDYKMVGWLGEQETLYTMNLLDKVKTSQINIEVDDKILPLSVTESKTKKKIYKKDGQFHVNFDVVAEAVLIQHQFDVKGETFEQEYLQRVEKIASKKIEENMKAVYKKIYQEYKADLIQSNEYLRKHEPEIWEQVKDDWDEIFPTMEMTAHVDIKLRRVGVVR